MRSNPIIFRPYHYVYIMSNEYLYMNSFTTAAATTSPQTLSWAIVYWFTLPLVLLST